MTDDSVQPITSGRTARPRRPGGVTGVGRETASTGPDHADPGSGVPTSARGSLGSRLQLLPALWLTVVWVLLWGSYSLVSVVGGALLAVLLLLVYPLPPLRLGLRIRPWPLIVLIVRFALDLLTASVHVAAQSVAPWVRPRGHLVTVDLRTDDDLFAMITAEMTALVPGTVVVDLDPDERTMTLHVFNARAEELPRLAAKVREQEARVLRALARDADQMLEGTP